MKKSRIWSNIILVFACALLLVAWQPALPPRPAPEPTATPLPLPPRPTSEPTATPHPKPPNGAVELTVESAPAGVWTVVQWQDGLGGWHDVEGWQGTLDADGKKTWWVDKTDLGKGPFRWAITQGGDLLAMSESFYLPGSVGETVKVSVSLAP